MSLLQLFWGDVSCNLYFQLCTFCMSLQAVIQERFPSFGKNKTFTAGPEAVPSATRKFLPPRWKESALKSPSKLLFTHSECQWWGLLTQLYHWERTDLSEVSNLGFDQGFMPWLLLRKMRSWRQPRLSEVTLVCGFWLISENGQSKPTSACWRPHRRTPGAQTAELFHVASPSPPAHTETVK